MNSGESYKERKEKSIKAAKTAVNVILALFLVLLTFNFTAYGLSYKNLPFIARNFYSLIYLTAGVLFFLLLIYYIAYILNRQAVYRLIFCAFVCFAIAAIIFYIINATGIITKLTSIEELRKYISGFGATAVLIFILFQFLQVVVLPVPGSISVAVGVALFGPIRCFIFSFIGILLGSVVAFFIGRVIGYKAVAWIVGKDDLDRWLNKMKGKDYLILSIMFLLPLFPDDILCFVAGLSSMSWTYFLVMIIITRAISVLTTSFSVDLIPFNTWWGITIWLIIAALVILAFRLVCKYSSKIDGFIKSRFKKNKI